MKLKALKRLNIYHLAVFFICIFHLGMNLLWLSKNTAPLPWDQAGHTLIAIAYSEQFKNLENFNLQTFLHTSAYYPPLWHITAGILTLFTGTPLLSGPIICTVLFLACILLIFKISQKLWHSDLAGVIACFIFSFLPPIYDHSRWFMLEIPLIFLVIVAFYFLWFIRIDSLKLSLLFGIILAAGLLTKWTFPIYLTIPFIYAIYHRKKSRPWLPLSLLVACIVATPWYIANLNSLLAISRVTVTAEIDDPQNPFSLASVATNISLMINQTYTWLGSILLCTAIYKTIKTKERSAISLLAAMILPLFVFTLIPNKNLRYLLPLTFFGCLLIGWATPSLVVNARRLWHKHIMRLLLVATFCLLTTYYSILSFGFPIPAEQINYRVLSFRVPILGYIDILNLHATESKHYAEIYNSDNWQHSNIFSTIQNDSSENIANVLVLSDKKYLNRENLMLNYFTSHNINSRTLTFLRPSSYSPNQFDYLITSDDLGPVAAIRDIALFRELKDQLTNNDSVHLLKVLKLPDNDHVYIYRIEKQN